ncbi:MAG: GDSL-type esterase/lipase family protein [Candidatus Binatia bacterium]
MKDNDLRICFVGDSYVNGTGDSAYLGWTGRVAIAARRKGYNLTSYNLGVRRETSGDIAQRWQQEVHRRFPSHCTPFVVFSFGANDTTIENGACRVAEPQSVDTTHNMLRIAQQHYNVALIGSPPNADSEQNLRISRLSRRFAEVAASERVPFLSVFDSFVEDAIWMDEVRNGDGAHPGATGYAKLAALVESWPQWWFR